MERGKGCKYTFLSPLSILLHFFLSLLIADIFKCHECRAEYLFPCRRRRRLTCLRACSYITYQSRRERRQQNRIYQTKDMLCTLNGREGGKPQTDGEGGGWCYIPPWIGLSRPSSRPPPVRIHRGGTQVSRLCPLIRLGETH